MTVMAVPRGACLGSSRRTRQAPPVSGARPSARTVSGPADYEAGCVQSLHIWVNDQNQNRVWEQPLPQVTCMAIQIRHIDAGNTALFQTSWPIEPSTYPGFYTVHGRFREVQAGGVRASAENLPVLQFQVRPRN